MGVSCPIAATMGDPDVDAMPRASTAMRYDVISLAIVFWAWATAEPAGHQPSSLEGILVLSIPTRTFSPLGWHLGVP